MAKYDPLRHHLEKRSTLYHEMTFDQIGDLVGGLPASAYKYPEWWSNEIEGSHVQARAWMEAGWRVDSLDLKGREVVFRSQRG